MKKFIFLRPLAPKAALSVAKQTGQASLLALVFILLLITVNAQVEQQPLIANTFFFNESTTTSTTFVTVGKDIFEVTRETPIAFVRASFQGTKLTGTDALDEFFWRILLDGQELVQATQSLELDEQAPIELQAGITDLSIGFHNITFQHRVNTLSLKTSEISFSLLTNQFLNASSIPLENQSISFTVDDIEIFTKFAELNFTKLRNDSAIFLSIFGQVTSSNSNVDIEIKLRMNGEESGVLSTGIQEPAEIKFVTYSWFFKDVVAGTNTIEVFARNLQNTKVTAFDGDIAIAETIGDNIEINFNETRVGSFVTSSTTPVLVDSFMIDISSGATLVVISETTVSKSTSGKDDITMFVDISNFGPSFNHTLQLEGASDIGNFPFIAVPPASPLIEGVKNISLFVFVESTTVTLTNTSFFAIEILPIEILAIVDNPPNVTLTSPPDNTITNETTITFETDIKDDFLILNASLFHNASGIFQINSTQDINVNETTVFFNITFPTNLTIAWNVEVTDSINQTSFAINNFILTINQTFPPDSEPPVITLIAPQNNTRNNTIPLPITFQVTDNSPNNIICELRNTTTLFDSRTFQQGIDQNVTLALGEISLSQNFPNLKLICFDNTDLNNSATLNLNYTLDTVPPIIFQIFPENKSRFNRDIVSNINIKANCTDAPVFRFNITISNASQQIASFETKNVINNFLVIDKQLNIQNLGSGNYTIDYLCSDPHTKQIIKDWIVNKDTSLYKIIWKTPSNNEYEFKYKPKGDDPIHALDYGSFKHEEGDRYIFFYIMNATEDGTERTFNFELENRKFAVDYLPQSEFIGHFIMQDNWLDLEFGDPQATYVIYLNELNNYEIEITTTKTILNFSSTGELNIARLETQFEIFFIEQIEDLFKVTECRTDTGSVLLLILFFLLSLFFIWLGLSANIGFIGFFGAIMMMVLSLFIAACIAIFAFIMALLSLVLIVFFVIRFIGFKNAPYQP